jgi:hypothetical protein
MGASTSHNPGPPRPVTPIALPFFLSFFFCKLYVCVSDLVLLKFSFDLRKLLFIEYQILSAKWPHPLFARILMGRDVQVHTHVHTNEFEGMSCWLSLSLEEQFQQIFLTSQIVTGQFLERTGSLPHACYWFSFTGECTCASWLEALNCSSYSETWNYF